MPLLESVAKRPGVFQIVDKKRYNEEDQSLHREILCLCQVRKSALVYQKSCHSVHKDFADSMY